VSISQWLLKFDRVLCILAVCNFCEGVALLLHTFLVSQVKANSRALGARLMKYGYKLVTDGTDNHLVLWDSPICHYPFTDLTCAISMGFAHRI